MLHKLVNWDAGVILLNEDKLNISTSCHLLAVEKNHNCLLVVSILKEIKKFQDSDLNKVRDNYLSIFAIWLQQLLEIIVTNSDDLRKPLCSHCERLGNIEYHPNLSKNFWRSYIWQKLENL